MKYAINTFLYEVAKIPILQALDEIKKFGFQWIDLAAYQSADPTTMSNIERRNLVQKFHDLNFRSSQLLLANTENIASSDKETRNKVLDYIKKCIDFQLELGGKQVLVCWGCGVLETGIPREQTWMYAVESIQKIADWSIHQGVLIDLEMDPHVYFVVNNMEKMAKILEDINRPNVFPNIDIGHLCITREAPETLNKFRGRILHVHFSETDTFEHTNSIIGSGKADFKSYFDYIKKLDFLSTCQQNGEEAIIGIEMGEPGGKVENPNQWIQSSLVFLQKILPELTFK